MEKVSEYFERVSYEHTKIADVSKDLDIAVGTLYKMFTSKENLYYEYLMYQVNKFYLELLENQTDEPKENIKFFIKLKYSYYIQKRKAIESNIVTDPFFFHKVYSGSQNPMNEVYKLLEKNIKLILQDDTKNYTLLSICLNRLSDGFIEDWLISDLDLLNEIDTTFNMFFNGINLHEK
ncbi:MAG: TetR/AcrR family transcriptional regulator [Campylobacterota bacterium]|nr:TetR/AcrR family transcriptional regulator [Campylobacterota bacterium]